MLINIYAWILLPVTPEPWRHGAVKLEKKPIYAFVFKEVDYGYGEPVNGIHLFMPCTGKEYVKGKTCGKCKESFFLFFCFWGPRGDRKRKMVHGRGVMIQERIQRFSMDICKL